MNNLFDPNTPLGSAFGSIFGNTNGQSKDSAAPAPAAPLAAVARIAPAREIKKTNACA